MEQGSLGAFDDIATWHRLTGGSAKPASQATVRIRLEHDDTHLDWSCEAAEFGRRPARFVRYVAAVINNLVMTHGGHKVRVDASFAGGPDILEQVESRYGQCLSQMRDRHGGEAPHLVCEPLEQVEPRPEKPRPQRAAPQPSGVHLGIDVGNTFTKVALFSNGTDSPIGKVPSELGNLEVGPNDYFMRLSERVADLLAGHDHAQAQTVGVSWFGDVYAGTLLTQAADLHPWSSGRWAEDLQNLPRSASAIFKAPVGFWGDSEVVGRALATTGGFENCYVLILGTSTGGAFIDDAGDYTEGTHLVSRIVINLADDAPRHSATRTPGVLQQYSGSYGLDRALAAHLDTMQTPRQPASYRLGSLLSSPTPQEQARGRQVVRTLAGWLGIAVNDLRTHYPVAQLVLAGGLTNRPLGQALVEDLRSDLRRAGFDGKIALLQDRLGWDSSYAAAIAAARLAASRQMPR